MSSTVIVHKDRHNVVTVNLGMDITGQTITSQIKAEPNQDGVLIAEWDVAVVDATEGEITLTITKAVAEGITYDTGWMDLKREDGTALEWAVFDSPLEVSFRGTVTE